MKNTYQFSYETFYKGELVKPKMNVLMFDKVSYTIDEAKRDAQLFCLHDQSLKGFDLIVVAEPQLIENWRK